MEKDIIENEVKRLFCYELYDFQVDRATDIIQHLASALGDDVIKVIREINVDWREPLRLYMRNTSMIINKLVEQYGDNVIEILKDWNATTSIKRGQNVSTQSGGTLDNIIKIFASEGTLVSKSQSEVVIRRLGCLVSEVARELGIQDTMYYLHCYGDPSYVEGINPHISCKHNKTCMQGDDCCEYLISVEN